MEIRSEIMDSTAKLSLVGRLDTVTAPEFERAVSGLPESVRALKVDFGGVEYVSSAGLRVLLSAQKKFSRLDGMTLSAVCEEVMEVFEITGFSDILTLEK